MRRIFIKGCFFVEADVKKCNSLGMEEIKIIANGSEFSVAAGQTVGGFIADTGIRPERCVVELNKKALKYSEFADLKLSDGDVIEVIEIVAGG